MVRQKKNGRKAPNDSAGDFPRHNHPVFRCEKCLFVRAGSMQNAETRMTNQTPMQKPEARNQKSEFGHWSFGIRHSDLIRHSGFCISALPTGRSRRVADDWRRCLLHRPSGHADQGRVTWEGLVHHSVGADSDIIAQHDSAVDLRSRADISPIADGRRRTVEFANAHAGVDATIGTDARLPVHDDVAPVDDAEARPEDVDRDVKAEQKTSATQSPLQPEEMDLPKRPAFAVGDVFCLTKQALKTQNGIAPPFHPAPPLAVVGHQVGRQVSQIIRS